MTAAMKALYIEAENQVEQDRQVERVTNRLNPKRKPSYRSRITYEKAKNQRLKP